MATRPTKRKSGSDANKTLITIGVVAVVAVIAIVLAVVISGGGDDDSTEEVVAGDVEQTQPLVINGDDLPRLGNGADTAVGETAPTISGKSFDGTDVRLGESGKPTVIMVIAHWCPHCQAEVPRIVDWINTNGMPEGVDLQAISTAVTDDGDNYPPSSWLVDEGWNIETLADDSQSAAATAIGTSSYPFFVVLDADRKVVARESGELTMDEFAQLIQTAKGA